MEIAVAAIGLVLALIIVGAAVLAVVTCLRFVLVLIRRIATYIFKGKQTRSKPYDLEE